MVDRVGGGQSCEPGVPSLTDSPPAEISVGTLYAFEARRGLLRTETMLGERDTRCMDHVSWV